MQRILTWKGCSNRCSTTQRRRESFPTTALCTGICLTRKWWACCCRVRQRSSANFRSSMRNRALRQRQTGIIHSAKIQITSGATALRATESGRRTPSTARWISPSIYRSQRRIPRRLRRLKMQSKAVIRSVSSAWKMRAMPAG